MNKHLKLFIYVIAVFAFYGVIAIYILLSDIGSSGWSGIGGYMFLAWLLIPVFSIVNGIWGSLKLRNVWIGSVTNFIGVFFIIKFLNSIFDQGDDFYSCFKYSFPIFLITFLLTLAMYRKKSANKSSGL